MRRLGEAVADARDGHTWEVHGAKADEPDDTGMTPLMTAAAMGQTAVARVLMGAGANITAQIGARRARAYDELGRTVEAGGVSGLRDVDRRAGDAAGDGGDALPALLDHLRRRERSA